MNKENKIVPELRFPEFQNNGEWKKKKLGDFSKLITKKTGTKKYKLLSVTAGVGLVSQMEKFGREIAGESYKNYYVIQNGDFAYNKSSVKVHPEGQIALLENEESGAVPNSIFTCFRVDKDVILPTYLKYPFENNIHGIWLRNFIAIGARANGALNVDNKHLLSLPVPIPSLAEQKKIASCLSSLDELFNAHTQKLNALKDHKSGLMQQLFPAEGETVPKLRFKEFEKDGEWVETTIGELSNVTAGGTPESTNEKYWNGEIPWMNSGELNQKKVFAVSNYITIEGLKNSSTKLIPTHCVLIGLAGQGKTRGTAAINYIELCTNQSIGAIYPNRDKYVSEFLYYKIDSLYDQLRLLSAGDGGRGGLNLQIIKTIKILLPKKAEQQKIANFLSSIDDEIAAQVQKIEGLKEHKKGLMQGLFPVINE